MSDDIVTRLRNDICWCADSYFYFDCEACQAADEIERLREDLNTTQELLARCYRMAVGHGPNFNVFDNWEEAISAYEREVDRG